ncbi:MAG: response regulator, partial [Desulfamplus sp.]|nr:response regulator [Desulfamplus sp.]
YEKSEEKAKAAEIEQVSPEPLAVTALKILVAEDNIANQKVAMAILKKLGFSADVVNNGIEAIESLRNKSYDLVLMDMWMLEMDGIEATKIIRSPYPGILNPTIPIVAMTASATIEDRQKCFDAGMNDFISKPVYPDELLSVIRKQMKIYGSEVGIKAAEAIAELRCKLVETFDRQDFLKRLCGDEKILKSFVLYLPESLSKQIENLKMALDKKDVKEIGFCAHTIKGLSANASAKRLCNIASMIESAGKAGKIDIAASMMEKLEHEYMELKSVLSDMFPENNTKESGIFHLPGYTF